MRWAKIEKFTDWLFTKSVAEERADTVSLPPGISFTAFEVLRYLSGKGGNVSLDKISGDTARVVLIIDAVEAISIAKWQGGSVSGQVIIKNLPRVKDRATKRELVSLLISWKDAGMKKDILEIIYEKTRTKETAVA